MPEDTINAISYSREVFIEQCRTEWAGLFWIGAEIAILFAVIIARRNVDMRCCPEAKTRSILPLLLFSSITFIVITALLALRHYRWLPVHTRLEAGEVLATDVLRDAYRMQNHFHYGLWAVFTATWVLLECSIVYQGWRVCAGVRRLLAHPVAIVLLVLFIALPVTAQEGPLVSALKAEDTADVLYRNALGLWLRVAGVIWIVVEWVAAVLLWRLYRFLIRVEACHD